MAETLPCPVEILPPRPEVLGPPSVNEETLDMPYVARLANVVVKDVAARPL